MNIRILVSEEPDLWLPARYEVCWRCHGEGTHTNPSIDGNGITQSDREEWDVVLHEVVISLRGTYDVRCGECEGLRVVLVPDEPLCDPAALAQYLSDRQELANMRAEEEAERRMGC